MQNDCVNAILLKIVVVNGLKLLPGTEILVDTLRNIALFGDIHFDIHASEYDCWA